MHKVTTSDCASQQPVHYLRLRLFYILPRVMSTHVCFRDGGYLMKVTSHESSVYVCAWHCHTSPKSESPNICTAKREFFSPSHKCFPNALYTNASKECDSPTGGKGESFRMSIHLFTCSEEKGKLGRKRQARKKKTSSEEKDQLRRKRQTRPDQQGQPQRRGSCSQSQTARPVSRSAWPSSRPTLPHRCQRRRWGRPR